MKCSESSDADPNARQREDILFNPMNCRLVFEHPRMLGAYSKWVGHIPFAYVLIEMLQPSLFVELGVYAGDSYCAFRQAVAELGLSTRRAGIDTWKGDPQIGFYPEDVFQRLAAYHNRLYADFSRLHRAEFDLALREFSDGEIDLLHIDGLHSYEAVKHVFLSWLPKLSSRAVVIFHDTHAKGAGFGVQQLWKEVCVEYPNFEFLHGFGLGVLGVGPNLPPVFVQFLQSAARNPDPVREFFAEMGSRFEAWNLKMLLAIEVQRAHSILDAWACATGQSESPAKETIQNSVVSAKHLCQRIQGLVDRDLRRGVDNCWAPTP